MTHTHTLTHTHTHTHTPFLADSPARKQQAAGITGLSLNQVDFTGKLVHDDTTGGMRSYHVAGH
jgi:hypothetical protein